MVPFVPSFFLRMMTFSRIFLAPNLRVRANYVKIKVFLMEPGTCFAGKTMILPLQKATFISLKLPCSWVEWFGAKTGATRPVCAFPRHERILQLRQNAAAAGKSFPVSGGIRRPEEVVSEGLYPLKLTLLGRMVLA